MTQGINLRILFVGFVWPEPTSTAASQNILSYIKACLNENWQVFFCSAAEPSAVSLDLAEIGVNCFQTRLNHSCFQQQVVETNPDIIIFDRFLSFEQFAWRAKEASPEALLVIDAEDLHFLRAARQTVWKKNRHHKTFMLSKEITCDVNRDDFYNDICYREIACILQADLTLVLSEYEKTLLLEEFGITDDFVAHVPFILNRHNNDSGDFNKRKDFVFIGSFKHSPNNDAVRLLAEHIWPKLYHTLRQHDPSVSCQVYGSYLSPKIKNLENKKQGFFVNGFADDQFSVIQCSRVMLAPIPYGAGVKGKLLDAMLTNTPSVTSPLGAEGITRHQWPGFISDNIDDFIKNAALLYTDQSAWQQAVNRITPIIEKEYSAQRNSVGFINRIKGLYKQKLKNKRSIFIQKLLWKQQFQSSRYMSQWIEAKNRTK